MPDNRRSPLQRMTRSGSFDQIVSNRLAEPRFQTKSMGAFALAALLLAIVGIYGVNAYAVMQRRNEIGLRMALGATPMQVLTEILKQGMLLTTIGIAGRSLDFVGCGRGARLLPTGAAGDLYRSGDRAAAGNKSPIQWTSKKGRHAVARAAFLVCGKQTQSRDDSRLCRLDSPRHKRAWNAIFLLRTSACAAVGVGLGAACRLRRHGHRPAPRSCPPCEQCRIDAGVSRQRIS
jgi:hypothetical protein